MLGYPSTGKPHLERLETSYANTKLRIAHHLPSHRGKEALFKVLTVQSMGLPVTKSVPSCSEKLFQNTDPQGKVVLHLRLETVLFKTHISEL